MLAIDLIASRKLQCGDVKEAHKFGLSPSKFHQELEDLWQYLSGIVFTAERALELAAKLNTRQARLERGPEQVLFCPVIPEESSFIHSGQLRDLASTGGAESVARK